MAQSFNFDVNPQVDGALSKLNSVKSLMEQIANIKFTASFDVNNFQQAADQLTRLNTLSKQLTTNFSGFKAAQNSSGNNDSIRSSAREVEQLNQKLKQVEQQQRKTKQATSSSGGGANYTSQTSALNSQNSLLDTQINKATELKNLYSDIVKLNSRQNARVRSATGTGRMTYEQNAAYESDNRQFSTISRQYASRASEIAGGARKSITDITADRDNAAANGADSARIKEYNDQIKAQENLIKQTERLGQALGTARQNVSRNSQSMSNANVQVSARRGSVAGILQQRAASYGEAIVGGTVANLKGRYAQGEQVALATNEDAFTTGQVSGGLTSTQMRRQLQSIGTQRSNGFRTQEDVAFYQTAMSRQGFQTGASGARTSRAMTNAYETNARASGAGVGTYANFMDVATDRGAVSSSKDVNDISDMIAGANKEGGTQGIQQQQLQALTSLVKLQGEGNNITKNQIKTTAAFQAYTSKVGGKAFQGEAGAQNLQNMDQSLKSAAMDPTSPIIRQMQMQNPAKYGGPEGTLRAQIAASKGLGSKENVNSLNQTIRQYGATYGAEAMIQSYGVSPEAASKYSKAVINGDPEGDLDKMIKNMRKSGNKTNNKNKTAYDNDPSSIENQSRAKKEASASKQYDAIGPALSKISTYVNSLPWALSALVATTGGILQLVATQVASAGAGNVLTKASQKSGGSTYGGGATPGGGSGETRTERRLNSKNAYDPKATTRTARNGRNVSRASRTTRSLTNRARNVVDTASDTVSTFFGGGARTAARAEQATTRTAARAARASKGPLSKITGLFKRSGGASDIVADAGKFSKFGGFMNRAAIPLMVASSALDVVTSKNKAKAATDAVGNLGGGWAGATAGAAIGTAFGPVGTAIGGVVGGVGGSLAGSGIADSVYDFFTGDKKKKAAAKKKVKDSKNVKAAAITGTDLYPGEDTASEKSDKNSRNEYVANEKRREKNVRNEKDNLDYYSKLLTRAEKIAKNGGSSSSSSSSSDSSSSSPTSSNSNGKKKKKSTFNGSGTGTGTGNLKNIGTGAALAKASHAQGTPYVGTEEIATIAEGNKAEALVSLDTSKYNRSLGIMRQLNQRFGPAAYSNGTSQPAAKKAPNVNVTVNVDATGATQEAATSIAQKTGDKMKQTLQELLNTYTKDYGVL